MIVPGPTGPNGPPSPGIMAPKPQVCLSVAKGQKLEVRVGEPVYVFVKTPGLAGASIVGLNKRTPFKIETLTAVPRGLPEPRMAGIWFKISVDVAGKKQEPKAGTSDQVTLVLKKDTYSKATVFSLVVGETRYYIM